MPITAFHRASFIVRISLEPCGDDGPHWHIHGEVEDAATREVWRFGTLDALAKWIERRIREHADAGRPGPNPGSTDA